MKIAQFSLCEKMRQSRSNIKMMMIVFLTLMELCELSLYTEKLGDL